MRSTTWAALSEPREIEAAEATWQPVPSAAPACTVSLGELLWREWQGFEDQDQRDDWYTGLGGELKIALIEYQAKRRGKQR